MWNEENMKLKRQMRPSRQRTKVLAILSVSVAAWVLASGFGRTGQDLLLKIKHGIEVFGKVYQEVALNYVDEIDPEAFIHAGIDGMLKTLDPYTVYLGERETDEIDLVTSGKYAGVGITVGLRDGVVTVINPIEGFSAAKQGIQSGDRILEIDGKSVKSMSLQDVRLMVRGARGTTVRMKIERDGEPKPLEFVLIREEIPVRNVTYAGFVEDGIGYIRLERFSRTAGDDLRNAVKELRSDGAIKSVILDLRGNPGGLLDVAVDVASKLLPESSLVVSTRGRRIDSERKYYSAEKPMLPNVPLAVLVDQQSASASEIVAGAIQDLDRGLIVGTRTFGKGLVQTITRLSESSSLKITSGRYYTPSGRCIQEIDYSRHSKDRIVTVKPESLRHEFRTSHNRRVLEGGGIMPDTVVLDQPVNPLMEELNRKAMFFKYANHYAAEKKAIPDRIEITNEILKDFEDFLRDKDFHYEEEAEMKLKELREAAEKGRYGKSFYECFEKIAKTIEAEKSRALERYSDEVRTALKLEIIARLKGEREAIKASLENDPQLEVAVGLLRDGTVYTKLLTRKTKS
ncbi:MAG: S41 family peptidase [Ignavibacteria bacterium]|nr:S41 family peptidase [Ignavibacteria bacterium]